MWAKLVEMIGTRLENGNRQPRQELAKAVNTLYGAMLHCRIAFAHFEQERTELQLARLVLALDAFLATLQTLAAAPIDMFDPEPSGALTRYALGEERLAALARPREALKSQVKLLRRLVRWESDALDLAGAESGGFSSAVEDLGLLIRRHFTLDELFGAPATRPGQASR